MFPCTGAELGSCTMARSPGTSPGGGRRQGPMESQIQTSPPSRSTRVVVWMETGGATAPRVMKEL